MHSPSPETRSDVISFKLKTAEGTIDGTLVVPRRSIRLHELVMPVAAIGQVMIEQAIHRESQAGRAVSCRGGCGVCCRQWVPLSIAEVFWIEAVIAELPPKRQTETVGRFDRISGLLHSRPGFVQRLLHPEPTEEVAYPQAREYFELGQACPFLEDESCSIYEQRPIACREFNVTSPAECCRRPYDEPVEKVGLPLSMTVVLGRAAAALTGTTPCLVPLTLAPQWAREHAELGRREWPGMQMIEALTR